ncbi:MAG: CbiX/SirB N-terminal domain-containing protein [Cyanobacteria bacterium P01_A01_bin.105]
MSTAYLLIAHGSRDPRSQTALNRLAQLVREQLTSRGEARQQDVNTLALTSQAASFSPANCSKPVSLSSGANRVATATLQRPSRTSLGASVVVGAAVLECSPLSLKQQIYEFGQRVKAAGIRQLKLVPIFLMAGVHVVDDLPTEVSAAQQQLGGDLELVLCEHLGSRPELRQLLRDRLAAHPKAGRLMVAHGSRRRHGNRKIEALARELSVAVAYWSVPPDLESQTIALMQQGAQTIAIAPYFLFSGGITDAIAHRTEELAERFPKIKFRLLPPLGASAALAKIVVNLVKAS